MLSLAPVRAGCLLVAMVARWYEGTRARWHGGTKGGTDLPSAHACWVPVGGCDLMSCPINTLTLSHSGQAQVCAGDGSTSPGNCGGDLGEPSLSCTPDDLAGCSAAAAKVLNKIGFVSILAMSRADPN